MCLTVKRENLKFKLYKTCWDFFCFFHGLFFLVNFNWSPKLQDFMQKGAIWLLYLTLQLGTRVSYAFTFIKVICNLHTAQLNVYIYIITSLELKKTQLFAGAALVWFWINWLVYCCGLESEYWSYINILQWGSAQ